jgi:hypothetical protein
MRKRILEPFIVAGASSQTIVGNHDDTACGLPIREVARPQDPQELFEAFADHIEFAG